MLLWKKNPDKVSVTKHLTESASIITGLDESACTPDGIKTALWPYVEAHGKGDVLWPLRVALTGQDKSPDPFVSAALLGKTESLKRIQAALARLSA